MAGVLDESCGLTYSALNHIRMASWRSGYAEDCKSLHPGSIPGEASILKLSNCFIWNFSDFPILLFEAWVLVISSLLNCSLHAFTMFAGASLQKHMGRGHFLHIVSVS